MDIVAHGRRKVVTTCTRDCPSCCGLVAVVESGRLTAITGNPAHPLNKGGCCAKMRNYVKRVYSPERVLHPMRRQGGSWRRIGWDEALDLLADQLKRVIAQDGPQAVLHYQGYGERTALKLLNGRFFALLGGATGLSGTLCSGTAYAAMEQDFGQRLSHDPLDHLNSRTLILWGRNPVATQFNLTRTLSRVRKQGGQVWLVDPVASETLPLCDRHIQPRPGADLHLALAAARCVLDNGWQDEAFITERAEGFEHFRDIVMARSVEEHAALADVPASHARDLARAMTQARPAAILLGWGMHRHTDAHLSVRAIDALCALTGNVGLPGGGVSQGYEEYGPYDQSVWGEDLHPPARKLLLPDIGRRIAEATDPPVRLAVISAANPACSAPDSDAVARALSGLEFVAYMGHFMDDTARLAHLFLPCATFLESDDVVAAYGHNYLGPVNKAIDPPGFCRTQFDIYQDLARRFPFGRDYIRPRLDWLRRICRPFLDQGHTLEDLLKGPLRDATAPMAPWGQGPFATASGRFRFLDALPTPSPASLSTSGPIPSPDDPQRPLRLLTVGSPAHICSELTLAEHAPLPVAVLHPDTAAGLGLSAPCDALLESAQATITVRVETDPRQRRDVCLCRRGGWVLAGHGLNRLIPGGASALGNGTPYYDTRVTLRPVDTDGPDI